MDIAPRWYDRKQVGSGIWLLRERHVHSFARCNIWYVEGRDCDLLIDSGTGLVPLRPALPARGRNKPIVATATHIHFDHVGCQHEFADRRAHASDAAAHASMPDEETLAYLFREMDDPISALPRAGWSCADYWIPPAPLTCELSDGDVIDLGDRRFTALHLPGHSPGSIGLFEEASGIFFSGDALYDGELIDDFPHSDVDQYRRTMERLRGLEISVGHGGHCESFDNARKLVLIEEYLAGRRYQGCPGGS